MSMTTSHDISRLLSVAPGPGTELDARRMLARVPIDQPPGLTGRLIGWLSRKMYGQAADNGFAMAANRKVLWDTLFHERRVAKFDSLDPLLTSLAEMAVATEIGCSWCVDFGFFKANGEDLDLAKLAAVPRWRDADNLSSVEKQVIEYAVASTATPSAATDEMVAGLREALGDEALIELTMIISIENQRSRFNASLGLVSQGFSASCRLPSHS